MERYCPPQVTPNLLCTVGITARDNYGSESAIPAAMPVAKAVAVEVPVTAQDWPS